MASKAVEAIIGYTINNHHPAVVVYDVEKCIEILCDGDGMDEEEALEYFEFNTLGAYVGESGPLFVRRF